MVQIIKEKRPRTTSEKFGQAFENAGQATGKFLSERAQSQQKSAALAQEDRDILAATGINLSGIRDPEARKAIMVAQLKGKQKEKELSAQSELLGKEYGLKSGMESERENIQNRGRIDLQKLKGAQDIELEDFKQAGRIVENAGKRSPEQIKEEEAKQVKQIGQESFNGIAKLLKKGNVGKGSGVLGYFGGETAKDTGEFQALSGGLEAMMVDMVSRGALSNTRFQYITETLLPKPTDTQSEIKGKLKGLSQILGLDASQLEGGQEDSDKEIVKGTKILDQEALMNISKQARGNKEKAKKIARKMGYIVE